MLFIDHISKLKRDRVIKKFTKAAKRGWSDLMRLDLHGHAGLRGADAGRDRRARSRGRCGLYARAEAARGRGMARQDTPVTRERKRFGIPVLTPTTLRTDEALAELSRRMARMRRWWSPMADPAEADPRAPCRSAVSTCMPRCCRAGAAPRRSIARSWPATPRAASCVMKMEEGLDTGAVALEERIADRRATMTAGELHDRLAALGARMMPVALGALERGTLQLTPQPDEGVTYAAKIDKAEARIDWAQAVEGRARPLPRALAVSWRVVRTRTACASRCCARRWARARARRARCLTTG